LNRIADVIAELQLACAATVDVADSWRPVTAKPERVDASNVETARAELGHAITLLEQTVVALEARHKRLAEAGDRWRTSSVSGRSQALDASVPSGVRASSVTIVNSGSVPIRSPRITTNAAPDLQDLHGLLRGLLGETTSDAQRALLLWQLVVEQRTHSEGAELIMVDLQTEPLQLISVLGRGSSRDAATALAALAQEAGMVARTWSLNDHVVAEVFYDDSWHMFDPDGEAYFLVPDGSMVASVSQLREDLQLLGQPVCAPGRTQPFYDLAAFRTLWAQPEAHEVSTLAKTARRSEHRVILDPGAMLRLQSTLSSFSGANPGERQPVETGRGEWIWQATSETRLARLQAGLEISLPFPLLDGSFSISGGAPMPAWTLQCKRAGAAWQDVPWHADAGHKTAAQLSDFLQSESGPSSTRLSIRVLPPDGIEFQELGAARIELTFRHAPSLLPRGGDDTPLMWASDTAGAHALVEVHWSTSAQPAHAGSGR